jgi:hypothetical protein
MIDTELRSKIDSLERSLAIPPLEDGVSFWQIRVKEGHGYHGAMIVPGKDRQTAVEVYWLRRAMQHPTLPLEIEESTAQAYAEQLEIRLGHFHKHAS